MKSLKIILTLAMMLATTTGYALEEMTPDDRQKLLTVIKDRNNMYNQAAQFLSNYPNRPIPQDIITRLNELGSIIRLYGNTYVGVQNMLESEWPTNIPLEVRNKIKVETSNLPPAFVSLGDIPQQGEKKMSTEKPQKQPARPTVRRQAATTSASNQGRIRRQKPAQRPRPATTTTAQQARAASASTQGGIRRQQPATARQRPSIRSQKPTTQQPVSTAVRRQTPSTTGVRRQTAQQVKSSQIEQIEQQSRQSVDDVLKLVLKTPEDILPSRQKEIIEGYLHKLQEVVATRRLDLEEVRTLNRILSTTVPKEQAVRSDSLPLNEDEIEALAQFKVPASASKATTIRRQAASTDVRKKTPSTAGVRRQTPAAQKQAPAARRQAAAPRGGRPIAQTKTRGGAKSVFLAGTNHDFISLKISGVEFEMPKYDKNSNFGEFLTRTAETGAFYDSNTESIKEEWLDDAINELENTGQNKLVYQAKLIQIGQYLIVAHLTELKKEKRVIMEKAGEVSELVRKKIQI